MTDIEKAELKKLYDRYNELKPLAEEFQTVVDKLRPMLCHVKVGDRVRWIQGGKHFRGRITRVSAKLFADNDPSATNLYAVAILPNGKEGGEWQLRNGCEKEVAA